MRVLVLGAGGQVGRALKLHMAQHGEVVALDRTDADLAVPGSVARAVEQVRPQLVANAAAYTAVDKAESESDLAMQVNAHAVRELADACRQHRASLIHYSTDYVFDGTKREPYAVTDAPAPVGAYGRTKLAGERAVAESLGATGSSLILRVAWVYAPYGKNFLLTMLRVAREGKPLRVVADQHGTPMSADWIARMTAALVRPGGMLAATGLHHLSPAGSTTWHGFAQRIMERAHAMGLLPGTAEPPRVQPITTADYPTPARRPAQSRLADSLGDLLPPRPDWSQLLDATLTQLAAEAQLPQSRPKP